MEPGHARMISGRPRQTLWGVVLLCLAIAGCGAEKPPPEVSGPCPAGDCRIELEHIIRITDADDPGILHPGLTRKLGSRRPKRGRS